MGNAVQVKIDRTDARPKPLDEYDIQKRALGENKKVTRPIGRISNDIIPRKSHRGAKKKYTPQRIVNAINKFFIWCENKDVVPTISGMMIHIKLYPKTFYKYLEHPEFTDIMEHARIMIKNWAEIDVYNTPGQAAGKIAFMKNIHGWSDRIETKNQTEITQTVVTVDEARAKVLELAPLLLEAMQSDRRLVEQMGTVEDAEIVKE